MPTSRSAQHGLFVHDPRHAARILMRVFIAGAAGAIGRQLIPTLAADGHSVTGTTRSPDRAQWLQAAGARPVIVDAYDRDAVLQALADARPEVVVHQLTDLATGFAPSDLVNTGRLRKVGTRHLIEGSVAVGVRRIVAQSGAWLYAAGPTPHDESHPLRTPTERDEDASLRGIIELERLVTTTPEIEGVVLRYGFFYGPNTAWQAHDAPEPHVSIAAAARATALAVVRGPAGVYNIVDDTDDITNDHARQLLGWVPDAD